MYETCKVDETTIPSSLLKISSLYDALTRFYEPSYVQMGCVNYGRFPKFGHM